jgi:hypothetical protein
MPSATIVAIAAAGEGQEPGLLLGGQRIGDEWYKRKQTAGYRSTGGEPCGSAGGKIGSGYEFKFNEMRNAIFHDRPPVKLPPLKGVA